MNTDITDNTSTIKATFFCNSLNNVTGISCRDLVITINNRKPKQLPAELQSLIGKPLEFIDNITSCYISLRANTIALNKNICSFEDLCTQQEDAPRPNDANLNQSFVATQNTSEAT